VILTFGYDLEFGGPVATVTEFYIVLAIDAMRSADK